MITVDGPPVPGLHDVDIIVGTEAVGVCERGMLSTNISFIYNIL